MNMNSAYITKHQGIITRLCYSRALPPNIAIQSNIETYIEPVLEEMIYKLSVYLAAKQHKKTDTKTIEEVIDIIKIPSSWWQHFKREYAPEWFTNRWPVKVYEHPLRVLRKTTTITEITNICPHTLVDKERTHFEFLLFSKDSEYPGVRRPK